MAYDEAFFTAYRAYLQETLVRKNHRRAFDHLIGLMTDGPIDYAPRVVDLGCGTGEFYERGYHRDYVGIDLNPRIAWQGAKVIKASSVDVDAWSKQLPFEPNTFVSVFSIEPMRGAYYRYELYDRLFRELPSLQFGMSAGFYYDNERMGDRKVSEAGGIVSWQTNQLLGKDGDRSLYNEEWLTMRTPSQMFGPDVVEVWKFFSRVQP